MKRDICGTCLYPLVTCLCQDIEVMSLPIDVVVLQHPKEARHAKNTVKVLSLVAPQVRVIDVSNDSMMESLEQSVNYERAIVFYPSDKSMAMEGFVDSGFDFESKPKAEFKTRPNCLMFIDATWPQAYGIWQANPWLRSCQQVHFSNPPASQYCIRSSKSEHQLSTLEAVAYSLNYLENISVEPIYRALNAMQAHWLRYQ